jgi:hypothetical protein
MPSFARQDNPCGYAQDSRGRLSLREHGGLVKAFRDELVFYPACPPSQSAYSRQKLRVAGHSATLAYNPEANLSFLETHSRRSLSP